MDIPTLSPSDDDMRNPLGYIHSHEESLRQYGAIKIIAPTSFKGFLRTRRPQIPMPTTIQQVSRLHEDNLNYSVNTVSYSPKKTPSSPMPLNEASFWRLLSHANNEQQIASVSIVPDNSFFLRRSHQAGFDVRRLACRSFARLWKVSPPKPLVPILTRTHGPGAIIPLASTRQRLPAFYYHHEGGIRHWYVIPARERPALEKVMQEQQNRSICIDHGHLLLDPDTLEKHGIAYCSVTQRPNEIIVLAAGVLSQSFSGGASWIESIEFALPSWLNDGHISAPTSCMCAFDIDYPVDNTDMEEFSRVLLEKYIPRRRAALAALSAQSKTEEPKAVVADTPESPSNESIDQTMNVDDDIDETPTSIVPSSSSSENPQPEQLPRPILEKIQQFSIATSTADLFESAEQSDPKPSEVSPGSRTASANTSETMEVQSDQQPSTPVPSKETKHSSRTHEQDERPDRPPVFDKKRIPTASDVDKTLFLDNLRRSVTKNDIYRHFPGSTKVKLSRSRGSSNYQEALVLHRTRYAAYLNRKRPLDSRLFGSHCIVRQLRCNAADTRENRFFDGWTLVARGIPPGVSEAALHDVFTGCDFMTYVQAAEGRISGGKPMPPGKSRILPGYAFLHYPDEREAARVMRHADRFEIDKHPLDISWYELSMSWLP